MLLSKRAVNEAVWDHNLTVDYRRPGEMKSVYKIAIIARHQPDLIATLRNTDSYEVEAVSKAGEAFLAQIN